MSEANIAVVRDFLDALSMPDMERAAGLLGRDVEWRNTGLPTVRGARVSGMLYEMERRRVGLDITVHHAAASDDTVLTERTDVLSYGRLRTEFWVCGTFTVQDGLITLWDDHFSMGNVLKGLVTRTAQQLLPR